MSNNNRFRALTGWKKKSDNKFLTSTQLVNEDWSVQGDWTFNGDVQFEGDVSSTEPISAADPVDPQDLVTLNYFNTHAGLYQGVLDASAGIPYPAASEGMYWRISVAGVIGTTQVEVGDQVIAIADYAGGMDDSQFMVIQTSTQITDVTYAQLQTLITNSALETGRQYRITDYATAYNIFDGGTNAVIEAQVGTVEPLIVLATGEATLAKEAYSELFPQDIIYYNPYALAVDRAAFIAAGDVGFITAGSLVAGFKGLIEFRHDTLQNVSTWYDFREVKFRRWAVDAAVYAGGTAYVENDICKGSDGNLYKCIIATTGEGDPTVNTTDWMKWIQIQTPFMGPANPVTDWSWTADNTLLALGNVNTANLIIGAAVDYKTFGDDYTLINNVYIGLISDVTNANGWPMSRCNNIVFFGGKGVTNVKFADGKIGNMTFAHMIDNVTFETETYGNFFSYKTEKSKFGQECYLNAFCKISESEFKDYFNNNSIFDSSYNLFGIGCSGSTYNSVQTSTINGNGTHKMSYCSNCNIADSNVVTMFGTVISPIGQIKLGSTNTVAIGSGSSGITIGEKNGSITLDHDCNGISIGDNNTSVTLGSDCSAISIGEMNATINIGDRSYSITIGNQNQTITSGTKCIKMSIGSNNQTITIAGTGSALSIGNDNDTIQLSANNANISIGNGNSVVTGDGCNGVTIHNDNGVVLGINANGVQIGDGNAISGTNNTIVGLTVGERNTLTLADNLLGITIGNNNGAIGGVTIGASTKNSTIGNGNATVTLGIDCWMVSIGNGNASIIIDHDADAVYIGNENTVDIGSGSSSISIANTCNITLGDSCQKLTFKEGVVFSGNTDVDLLDNVTFESNVSITAVVFTAATHVKAGGYNKTVFMNATPTVQLYYFDALNALTVDDVNA